jgi:hypothetical protein
MRFSVFKTAAITALALCSDSVLGQLTPNQVVANIDSLRMKSQALIQPAREISIVNAPLIIIGQGPLPVRASLDISMVSANLVETHSRLLRHRHHSHHGHRPDEEHGPRPRRPPFRCHL